jgi:lysine-specific demethylase 3
LHVSPSRFCKVKLGQAIKDMEALLGTPDGDALGEVEGEGEEGGPPELVREEGETTDSSGVRTPPDAVPPAGEGESVQGAKGEDLPCHETRHFADAELTEEVFCGLWARGEPLVVTGLLPKFQLEWSPTRFMDKYNAQTCLVIECQSDVNKRVTVGEFFSWFGAYEGRTGRRRAISALHSRICTRILIGRCRCRITCGMMGR